MILFKVVFFFQKLILWNTLKLTTSWLLVAHILILATQEAEMRKIEVHSQPWENSL
jgi:hypothetical protein